MTILAATRLGKLKGRVAFLQDLLKAFNSNQPRDEWGRWVDLGVGGVVAYHGTSAKVYARVMRQGIKPQGSPGNDFYVARHTPDFPSFQREVASWGPSNIGRVFITRDLRTAKLYAQDAARDRRSKRLILRLAIPKKEFLARARRDPKSHVSDEAFRFAGTIKPEWIVGPVKTIPKARTISEILGKAEPVVTLYVVLRDYADG